MRTIVEQLEKKSRLVERKRLHPDKSLIPLARLRAQRVRRLGGRLFELTSQRARGAQSNCLTSCDRNVLSSILNGTVSRHTGILESARRIPRRGHGRKSTKLYKFGDIRHQSPDSLLRSLTHCGYNGLYITFVDHALGGCSARPDLLP
jgi:hypothetical protein